MSDGPILVVSDTHFGFEDASAKRFQRFMRYLTDWVRTGRKTIENTNETLDAPHKIILLGDFIDLWVSRDKNTVRPFKESFNVVKSLIALNREIVYVAGNHDDILGTYYARKKLLSGVRVYERYPKKVHGKSQGEKIGELTYLFLHGHQFDAVFRHRSMLRLGNFFGFASARAEGFWGFKWLGAIVFLLTLGIIISAAVSNWLSWLLSGLTALLNSSPWYAAPMLLLGGWLLGAIAFLGILWIVGIFARGYYDWSLHPGHTRDAKGKRKSKPPRPRKTIKQVIATADFAREQRRIDANVIVFGHTHEPEMCIPKNGSTKLLVNSGSWIEQRDNKHDTFVYIDDDGPRLLQWHNKSRYMSQLKCMNDCDDCADC
jgi:UDP-2,3-diacylglucosamine pyrophosphatase LpxH